MSRPAWTSDLSLYSPRFQWHYWRARRRLVHMDAARCESMPPGMHPAMQALIGAQYHRCRLGENHEPPCVNNEGVTWGYVTSPGERP